MVNTGDTLKVFHLLHLYKVRMKNERRTKEEENALCEAFSTNIKEKKMFPRRRSGKRRSAFLVYRDDLKLSFEPKLTTYNW